MLSGATISISRQQKDLAKFKTTHRPGMTGTLTLANQLFPTHVMHVVMQASQRNALCAAESGSHKERCERNGRSNSVRQTRAAIAASSADRTISVMSEHS